MGCSGSAQDPSSKATSGSVQDQRSKATEWFDAPHVQVHFRPLESAPRDWPLHGKFFPLGPETKAKGEWNWFWNELAVKKKVFIAGAANRAPKGPQCTASEVVQALSDNLRTYILATVYCPGWAQGWARSVLDLIVFNVRTCESLNLIAVKGGPACDEEIAFLFVIMSELGLTMHSDDNSWETMRVVTWSFPRDGGRDYVVQLVQYRDIHCVKDIDMDMAPAEHCSCEPDLSRYAVISCAESWFIDGKPVRVNVEETDADHPDGMTVNDKLNALLVAGLKTAKERASVKGFRPTFMQEELLVNAHPDFPGDPEAAKLAQVYFDRER